MLPSIASRDKGPISIRSRDDVNAFEFSVASDVNGDQLASAWALDHADRPSRLHSYVHRGPNRGSVEELQRRSTADETIRKARHASLRSAQAHRRRRREPFAARACDMLRIPRTSARRALLPTHDTPVPPRQKRLPFRAKRRQCRSSAKTPIRSRKIASTILRRAAVSRPRRRYPVVRSDASGYDRVEEQTMSAG